MTSADRVGVVGLGYVGLPLSLAFLDAGYTVIGVDTDTEKVRMLQDGRSYVTDVPDDRVSRVIDDRFSVSTDYAALAGVDGVAICVPTPLRKTGQPNLSYVVDATERLATVLSDHCVIVLESTVYPGATDELLAPTLVEHGFTIGEDVFLAFSPERIDPGRKNLDVREIPKVLGGITPACRDRAVALYEPVFSEIVQVNSATEAELVKLLENTFRAINIGMINETAQIAHHLDVDVWNVVDAAATKPYGFMPFYPGPGLGGHCIPIDPQYLSWKANQHDIQTRFIDLADQVNREMPPHVVQRVTDLLNEQGLAVSRSSIMVVGVAYKPDVSDVRESPAYDVLGLLAEKGADLSYHDPHVPKFEVEEYEYASVSLSVQELEESDCVLIVTDHEAVDYEQVVDHASLVFDTRNAIDGDHAHVEKL